ncbi:MAG: choice-of-anchor D domain-containing protein [Wenzhouxiangella sp.]|jgi:hypothetical protein|nr:choice-of-anchor D domain-containing protein [Wenzhouxiangella sp.]
MAIRCIRALALFLLFSWQSCLAIDEYRLDDGVKDSAWGLAGGGGDISFAWLNQFTVESGLETITGLRVAFGGDSGNNNVANGTSVTFYLWADPNQDGDPSDAFVITSWSDLVASTGSNTLNTYPMPSPQTLAAGDSFFAGAIINGLANVPFPNDVRVGALDEDGNDTIPNYPPALHSWVASSYQSIPVDPGDLDGATNAVARVSNAFPLPTCQGCSGDGTWLIRINAQNPSGTPQLSISPDSLNFGPSRVGEIAGPLATTLTSSGTASVDVTAITPATSPWFLNTLVPGACHTPPFSLVPGASCTLDYTFAPTAAGLQSTSITVSSNTAPPPPAPVLLVGEGVDVILEVLPLNLDFGTVAVGETVTASLQVINASNGTATGFDLEVLGVSPALPPEFAIAPGTCGPFPFTLAYQAGCDLEVQFTPTAPGGHIFTAELISDASVTPGPFDITGDAVIDDIFADRFQQSP